MSEANLNLTAKQLQDIITTAVSAAVREAVKPSPLEERQLAEALDKERRHQAFLAGMAKSEAEAEARRKNGCTHSRWPAGTGKKSGHPAPTGQGEWTTGGQTYQNGTAGTICLRCQRVWVWRPSPDLFTQLNGDGMLGTAPPPEAAVIQP